MKYTKGLVFYSLLVIWCATPNLSLASSEEPTQSEYYTVDDSQIDREIQDSFTYQNSTGFNEFVLFNTQKIVQNVRSKIVNMLRFMLHAEERPVPQDPYARKLHFGRWINDPYDDTCMNTRAIVLVRESETEVKFRKNRNCVVDSGRWYDAYSDTDFELAKDIQIDHMVPLKNAYVSGAWEWDYKTRCLYANYMGYKNHLVPASARENTSKGDRGPEKFLPSNFRYRCQYIKDWLAIKLIWNLTMSQDEVAAIEQVVKDEDCDTSDFKMSQKELYNQRRTITDNIEYCLVNKR